MPTPRAFTHRRRGPQPLASFPGAHTAGGLTSGDSEVATAVVGQVLAGLAALALWWNREGGADEQEQARSTHAQSATTRARES